MSENEVSQQHVDSPNVIYDTLIADGSFMAMVGTRSFKEKGTSMPAISILSPGEKLESIKSTTGLEVVIHDVAPMQRRKFITGDISYKVDWRVFLIAWPGSNGHTIRDAASTIMLRFSEARMIETVPSPEGLGAIMQALVIIPDHSIVLDPAY